ncbi:MAG: hypothetical protein ACRD01_11385 [Terriglobales bacterium]
MKKSQDELVLAVPRKGVFAVGEFQGLVLASSISGGAMLRYIFDTRHARFLPRSVAEEDPAWKQIIPYVVLHCDGEIFCYRRGQQSTETRLRTLQSVGLGGHIRHTDEGLFAAPGWASYHTAMEREMNEEVVLVEEVRERHLTALVNDETSPVGRMHLGLVHLWELWTPAVRAREPKIAEAHWESVAELANLGALAFETWSQLVLAHWGELRQQPGWRP